MKDLFLCQCTLRQMIAHTSAEEAQEQERAQIALAEKQAKESQDRRHRRDDLLHVPHTGHHSMLFKHQHVFSLTAAKRSAAAEIFCCILNH